MILRSLGRSWLCEPMLVAALVIVPLACGDDGSTTNDSSATTAVTTSSAGPGSDDTVGPPMLEEPYGPCAGPMAGTECVDAGPTAAECIERDGPGGAHSTCALWCLDSADCPPAGAGNIAPQCVGADASAAGRCLLDCNPDGANSCPSGTVCLDGDPPLCMWPQQVAGHVDAQSFCETACGECGSTLLLPWTGECVTECVADVLDCSDAERDAAFACTGGQGCPAGGGAVASCLQPIACVDGSGG